jgi:DNA-binding transcriptional regulator YiaG
MPRPIPPNERPDSAILHINAVRRFREELRLNRHNFASLLDVNVDTLRVWETPGASKPRGASAIKIVELAEKNHYPMSLEDIFSDALKKKKKKA